MFKNINTRKLSSMQEAYAEPADDAASFAEESADDGVSSSDGTTTTGTGNKDPTEGSHGSMTSTETKRVNKAKLLVYISLLIAAAGVGAAAYVVLRDSEVISFHDRFHDLADEVTDVTQQAAHKKFGQLHQLATAVTSYVSTVNVTWPNVTVPHFDLRAQETEAFSGMEAIAFVPLLKPGLMVDEWVEYAQENQVWIDEALEMRELNIQTEPIPTSIYPFDASLVGGEHVAPMWQVGPVPTNTSVLMVDLFTHPTFRRMITEVLEIKHVLLSEVIDVNFILEGLYMDGHNFTDDGHPRSCILMPVFDEFEDDAEIVGFLVGVIPWEPMFTDVLTEGSGPVLVEVHETCGANFTYIIEGHDVRFAGEGDMHQQRFDELGVLVQFAEEARYDGLEGRNVKHCSYSLEIFPTATLESRHLTTMPIMYTGIIVLVFLCTMAVFLFYDIMVARRQNKLAATAKRTNQIVTSLFPKEVQERMMAEVEAKEAERKNNKKLGLAPKNQLNEFLHEGQEETDAKSGFSTKPIADLFPNVTIMFADLVGFTAWSSMREPAQVFMLLESIFHEFDTIAKRRRVFKVETVGDCYVAVVGLPEPRKDHATVMARFARDCLYKMGAVTRQLEVTLGPDTADLGIRIGLHSGPVTAGVLRGERARFQLFGDTMNTTSRIESTGARNRIHISQDTADLLKSAGKSHWLTEREDKVFAKGKGELATYWLELRGDTAKSSHSGSSGDSSSHDDEALSIPQPVSRQSFIANPDGQSEQTVLSEKYKRLIGWNTEILLNVLREVVAKRNALQSMPSSSAKLSALELDSKNRTTTVLEEVQEVITLPQFDAKNAAKLQDQKKIMAQTKLEDKVSEQLHEYLETIAALYRLNPFHNFEHASHVTMSVVKLFSRIVAPDIQTSEGELAKDLHDHTYGITSDPLTQFACILSALIHDVDHQGVPNTQLIKENAAIAAVYKGKSVAEQNSVDIAWDLLMQDTFVDLRRTIYTTVDEFKRFRQLVVNSVMATDIMDKELSGYRKARWNKAFATPQDTAADSDSSDIVSINRKATIVIEHLIQASDVAHTMQHWHIYRKWNARLFEEMYKAYTEGRSAKNPAEFWYEGEIGFFDFYIIPLAMKLKSCGVFGVSSDEYLTYAQQNRREWELKGREVVEELVTSARMSMAGSGK